MANLEEMAAAFRNEGYSEINAEARVCQDIVLSAIAKSSLSNRKSRSWLRPHDCWGNLRPLG